MQEIKHVYIAKSCLFVNGQLVLKGENSIFVKYLKEVYKYADIKYSKYFKMDPLSKLGFLAAEVLLKDKKCSESAERNGIVLENKVSTYLVDMKHQITINDKENYFPSPANFVYTLPNVMTGEICIRHGFKGENAVFVNNEFDAKFVCQYIKSMYTADKADMLIGGFVDADEDDYEAFVFFTKKEDAEHIDAKLIEELYQKSKALATQ
ncbi:MULTISPECIES: 3-oxoacyl-ACP synthase [unclassified Lentimicrobium]|uniref:3-oxoacyl-ACP synthase n=1 Tax=unclassified Lentimicrobium TaxID=2677434 RepID=UPI001557ADBB|nr:MULTISPECIES: 3-oxoacyl-ACP synthase [unclassified Lentimicrobium]NPD45294.1 3-oxoacyl-ACP synthase [Lentimicrobium sp. S6]NPD84406.1 3-oxoacyl-ACP synthase [Lentimicrobium sp. L6]